VSWAGPAAPDWAALPPLTVTGAARLEGPDCCVVPTDQGALRVTLHAHGARLRLGSRPVRYDYGLLASEPRCLPLALAAGEGEARISAGELSLRLEHAPLAFELTQGGRRVQASSDDGHFVRRHRLPPFARTEAGWFVALGLRSGEPVYGLGEKWSGLNRRGQWLRSFNQDALGVNAEHSYKNTPFAWSPSGWGVWVHTPAPVTHSVGCASWSHRSYALLVEDEALDLFLLAGADGAALIGQYTALTGRAPVPPLWSLGVILSKAYYRSAEEILAVAREVRRRAMPCDTITFDGRAWQDTETRFAFQWDPRRYPDPRPLLAELKGLGFRICVWEYPLVSVHSPLFAEMAAKGWLLKDERTGEAYRYEWEREPFGPILTPLPASGIVDFTHPEAYAFWRDQHQGLFEAGVDMIKADFGEQVGADMVAANGERGHALHNVYALLYNRCVYEAAARYAPGGPFLFSRAAWSGSQRYPSQWGGDPQADFEGLAASLRGAQSWGLSGAPFFASDVGGFYGDTRDPVLYLRWLQAAVFGAHLRLHGVGEREPWSYGEAAAQAANAALALRYRLLPYLLATLREAAATGLPVQRAMALAFPGDRAAWAFEDQFMCGDALLVAPCLRRDGRVSVYLPAGDWQRFPEGGRFTGGRCHELELALEEMAVFAPRGARIALGPAREHCGELGEAPPVTEIWLAD